MKNMLYIIMCAVLLLTACDKDAHDEPQPGNSFVAVALMWEDKLNSTDDIQGIDLWIYDKTGKLVVEEQYPSALELASHSHEVASGNIAVVVGLNVKEPLKAAHTATPADLKFELARQCALYEMTYYGDKTSTVDNGAKTIVVLGLHDKPQDNTFITPDPDIDDWEDGDDTGGDVFKPKR